MAINAEDPLLLIIKYNINYPLQSLHYIHVKRVYCTPYNYFVVTTLFYHHVHIMHFFSGFINDPLRQLNAEENSGIFCIVPRTLEADTIEQPVNY
jgi:hypothetical protein